MANAAPYEIIAQPFTLYVAPVGTAFPDVGDVPGILWTKVGTSGNLNYDEKGVEVQHKQKTEVFRSLGDTGPRKAFRSEEDLLISMVLVDISLEQYSLAINFNAVGSIVQAPGVSGGKKLGLTRGSDVTQRALLVRGEHASAYGDLPAQYEVPVAIASGDPKVVYVKKEPAGLELEWMAMVDPDATSDDERFGRLVMATTVQGT
jgi:hypothetical protein